MTAVPEWLRTLSVVAVVLALLCAVAIAIDLRQRPQRMWIMNLVWPLTALYAGPLGLWAYWAIGRKTAQDGNGHGKPGHNKPDKPFWQVAFTGATHCGAGCAVGDFIGEWLVFLGGVVLLGSPLLTKYVVAFVLAYLLGIFFQYFSIAPMRGLGLREGLWAAVKADTLSLTAYEVGMFGWMAVTQKLLFPGLEPTSWTFWFMMQVAMLLGLATTFPVNWWLIRRGTKEAM